MTRDPWDAVIVPQCDVSCPWRQTCSNWVQEGVAMLWRSGQLTKPEDCVFYAHRAKVHRETTGFDAPGSIAELEQQLATHKPAGPA